MRSHPFKKPSQNINKNSNDAFPVALLPNSGSCPPVTGLRAHTQVHHTW